MKFSVKMWASVAFGVVLLPTILWADQPFFIPIVTSGGGAGIAATKQSTAMCATADSTMEFPDLLECDAPFSNNMRNTNGMGNGLPIVLCAIDGKRPPIFHTLPSGWCTAPTTCSAKSMTPALALNMANHGMCSWDSDPETTKMIISGQFGGNVQLTTDLFCKGACPDSPAQMVTPEKLRQCAADVAEGMRDGSMGVPQGYGMCKAHPAEELPSEIRRLLPVQ